MNGLLYKLSNFPLGTLTVVLGDPGEGGRHLVRPVLLQVLAARTAVVLQVRCRQIRLD